MRAAVESDIGLTARRVVKAAEAAGWYTVGVVSEGTGAEPGQVETVLSLRGSRAGGTQRFVVLFIDGSVEASWWWTREHTAVDKGYRREDVWVKTKYAGRVWYPGTRVEVLEPRLKRDASLDVEVVWTAAQATWRKLGSLSELVGVASGKNPRPGLLDSQPTQE